MGRRCCESWKNFVCSPRLTPHRHVSKQAKYPANDDLENYKVGQFDRNNRNSTRFFAENG